jgi:hypothetical protein
MLQVGLRLHRTIMYQSPVYLSSTSPHTNGYEPRRTEYDQVPTPASYHLSSPQPTDDSPYWIGSVPSPSTYRSSSPTRRASPSLEKRDSGIDTNIAGLVISGVVGTISICFQAKGNSIASASYQLALDSRDAAIGGAQAVGSGVAATGGRIGGTVGGGVMAVGNAVGEVATGQCRLGHSSGRVKHCQHCGCSFPKVSLHALRPPKSQPIQELAS